MNHRAFSCFARDPLPDNEQKQAALSYLNEAWAEARHDGVDGDCLAQASLFAAFAELVGTYGEDALFAASGRGWWLGRPVEVPGSRPIEFEGGRSIGSRLASWPREQVVKCLVRYHPDEPANLRREQETQLRALYDAVQASGHELLLEVIPPTDIPCDDRTIARALDRIYQVGIFPEWWKLAPMSRETWKQVDDLIARRDPWCRGVLVLGLNAPIQELVAGFRDAAASRTCRGFAVGRTIWHEPSREWLAGRIGDAELISRVRASFETLIREWRSARASRKEGTA